LENDLAKMKNFSSISQITAKGKNTLIIDSFNSKKINRKLIDRNFVLYI